MNMLKETIPCDVYEIEKYNFDTIDQYTTIIAAGGVYATGVSCMKYIRKHINSFVNKNLAVFAVGASPFDEKAFHTIKTANLKNIPFEIPMFYGRGSYDESVMSFRDKMLCGILKKSLSKKDPSTYEPWEIALMSAEKKCDWVDKIYLEPLLEYIKNFPR